MAAMTSFHAEKCCHLVSAHAHTAYGPRLFQTRKFRRFGFSRCVMAERCIL